MTAFLRWWIIFVLIIFGSAVCIFSGIVQKVNNGDITKISFLIYGIFMFFSVHTGYLTKRQKHKPTLGIFVSNSLLTLGIIGTVIGLIYSLSLSFVNIDPSNELQMREALGSISLGMSTALFTTATGLITSLILKIQLFNLGYGNGK